MEGLLNLPPVQESAIDDFYIEIEFAQLGGEAGGSQGWKQHLHRRPGAKVWKNDRHFRQFVHRLRQSSGITFRDYPSPPVLNLAASTPRRGEKKNAKRKKTVAESTTAAPDAILR
jgi:hypothetical protein